MPNNRALCLLHWLSRTILAAIFLYTGYIKIKEPLQFAVAISGYKLFPDNFIYPIAQYFPWFEIALGILLLIGWKIRYVAGASAALLLFFTVIISVTYLRGIDANCGCFSFHDKITPKTIARDSIILLPALFLLWKPTGKQPKTEPAIVGSDHTL